MAQLGVKRGDDRSYLATFWDINDTAQDLTGCRVFFTIKAQVPSSPTDDLDDTSALLKYHWQHDGASVISSEGMSIPAGQSAGDGQLEVRFPRSWTTTLAALQQKYEVAVVLPDDTWDDDEFDDTWDSGDFQVTLDLNRRRTP